MKKSERKLLLYYDDKLVRTYSISLGKNPFGDKLKEGDNKTPEGNYTLDWIHPNSSYYKAIHISYPSSEDILKASQNRVNPGGDIMIHGMPNGFGWLYPIFSLFNWTRGCIALSNTEMEEITSSIKVGTKIIIKP